MLRNIVDTMLSVVNGTNNEKKIDIFSGHESNIVSLLYTLGIFKPHVPEYSSAIFIELHRAEQYYVKVRRVYLQKKKK